MTRGYIYINSSKSYPKGILKIGRSYDAEGRRREHSTALPYPQVIEKKYSVKNMISAEKVIHQALKKYHHYNGAGTEFFNITLNEAIKVGDGLFLDTKKKNNKKYSDDTWLRYHIVVSLRRKLLYRLYDWLIPKVKKYKLPTSYGVLVWRSHLSHQVWDFSHWKDEIKDLKYYMDLEEHGGLEVDEELKFRPLLTQNLKNSHKFLLILIMRVQLKFLN